MDFDGTCVTHEYPEVGKIRGLFCAQCNVGLGKFQESAVFLQKAIDYLQKNN